MKTHRCGGSLKAHISIRYDDNPDALFLSHDLCWRLRRIEHDYDYDAIYLENLVGGIEYCPFCGEKLEEDS